MLVKAKQGVLDVLTEGKVYEVIGAKSYPFEIVLIVYTDDGSFREVASQLFEPVIVRE